MDYPPLKGAALAWVTLSLGLAVFMEVLDTTIANVAVPVIAGNLGAATSVRQPRRGRGSSLLFPWQTPFPCR